MSCDMAVAADGATSAITPAKIGVPYDIEGRLSFRGAVGLPIIQRNAFHRCT